MKRTTPPMKRVITGSRMLLIADTEAQVHSEGFGTDAAVPRAHGANEAVEPRKVIGKQNIMLQHLVLRVEV